jgi:hypothetical protein
VTDIGSGGTAGLWTTLGRAVGFGARRGPRSQSDTFSPPLFPMSDGVSTLPERVTYAPFHRPYYYRLEYPKELKSRGWAREVPV